MKYSFDKRVSFDNKTHSYFLGKKKLISVTTLLSKFKNKFNSDYWSVVISKRDGKTKEEVLMQWEEKSKKSCAIGTAIHKIFEDYTLGNYCLLQNQISIDFFDVKPEYFIDFHSKAIVATNFIKDFFITKRIIPIHSEYICYNDSIAGQIDMICTDSKNNYYILDFKTNEKIDFNSYKNIKMLGVLDFIEDSSYWHYCLQLSIYKELCKEFNIKKLYLIHITNEKYYFIECEDILKKITLKDILL